MLYQVMKHIRNFFPVPGGMMSGEFKIEEGVISLPSCLDGQFYLIEGSVLNDGVHQHPATDLIDETFRGQVTLLAIPRAFIDLVEEIEKWDEKNGAAGAFQSESFGDYSYTRATNEKGAPVTWSDAFKSKLNVWRKI
ncbi:MAG: hypothetical protein MJZ26_12235 [Fibrobacter sp.]|nr:hypothetical protein [Fibrobacter sp.]